MAFKAANAMRNVFNLSSHAAANFKQLSYSSLKFLVVAVSVRLALRVVSRLGWSGMDMFFKAVCSALYALLSCESFAENSFSLFLESLCMAFKEYSWAWSWTFLHVDRIY